MKKMSLWKSIFYLPLRLRNRSFKLLLLPLMLLLATPMLLLFDLQQQEKQSATPTCVPHAMTVVSGFMNIGNFKKDSVGPISVQQYRRWLKPLALLENPLIFYTDDAETAAEVTRKRSQAGLENCTRVVRVSRSEMWGFTLLPEITAVLKQPDYPKFSPNTVMPTYAAAMHSKYSMMELALDSNPFDSEYFAWMDSGLFKDDLSRTQPILLSLPPGFNQRFVAANQIVPEVSTSKTIEDIFLNTKMWFVGGGFLIANSRLLRKWCRQYRAFTEYFLQLKLSNTDQQVIYAMFTDGIQLDPYLPVPPSVRLQRYSSATASRDSWYHLRDLSADEGARQKKREQLLGKLDRNPTAYSDFLDYMDSPDVVSSGSLRSKPVSRPCDCESNVTLVVAFFDFGSLVSRVHSEQCEVRDFKLYSTWFTILARTKNPVVAYFDSEEMLQLFKEERTLMSSCDCTHTELIDRESLWSWKMYPWLIRTLAKHPSNRNGGSIPEHFASLHSKFAVIEKAAAANWFNTDHLAWLDAALLRYSRQTRWFTVRKLDVANRTIEYLSGLEKLSEEYKIKTPSGGDNFCHNPISTKYLVGETGQMHALSKAYRLAARTLAIWNSTRTDTELIKSLYCEPQLTLAVSQLLGGSLPPLVPVESPRSLNELWTARQCCCAECDWL